MVKGFCAVVLVAAMLMSVSAADIDSANAARERGDYETAFVEFKALAEQGHAGAQFSLGSMYETGKGVPVDDGEAVKWFFLAAEQGHSPARLRLTNGVGVLEEWLRRVAEQGSAEAQLYLGRMYSIGEKGFPEDDSEAVKWYRLAAEQGVAEAQFNLGFKYANGMGVPEDTVQAYAWWNLAAAQGYEDAKSNKLILAGLMTPSQIAEAQKLSKELYEKIPH